MVAAWPLSLLGLVTAALAWEGGGPASALRHLYLVPTVWAALRLGTAGGCLTGLMAGLLQALLVLPVIERLGLGSETLDGLVSLVMPLAFGAVVGRLVDQSRARGARLRALLEIERALVRDDSLEARLQAVSERVRAVLGADRVAVVVAGEAGQAVVASHPPAASLDDRSAAVEALRTGQALWVKDLERDERLGGMVTAGATPLRGAVQPLTSGRETVGVLALEWAGDPPPATRVAAEELAVHLALGIENARLTLRQRRFAGELEEKVAAATRRLMELDQVKSEFLSVVSHELRTPLTALQGFSELLLSRQVAPERAQRFLGHVHSEAQRLGRIVAQLLDLSRIEAGRAVEVRREPVDLAELIERNLDLCAAEHHEHRFQGVVADGLPTIQADRDALDRILKNLLSNAVKYSPQGGVVRVAAGKAADHADMIEIAVEDQGVGIPAEALSRIFDKYVRIQNPETASARGLGLGLSLVRALAEAHGGLVEVESLPGKGSRFRLLLPW